MSDEGSQDSPLVSGAVVSFSEGYRGYVLLLFLLVQMTAVIDRQVLAILAEPIKAEFGLSDLQLGILTGLAFALFYATMSIPIAAWVDRGNRRNIVALALVVWSTLTALTGIAANFWHLFLYRLGVGAGEAAVQPSTVSIISDFYAPEERSRAIAIASVGVSIAPLIGFPLGGWLGDQFGWRVAFIALGLPGVALALIVRMTFREPPRGYSEGRTAEAEVPGVLDVFRFALRTPTVRHLLAAGALVIFAFYSLSQWLPTFFRRSHGMSGTEVGIAIGLLVGVAGSLGTFLGGWLSDLAGRRDVRWTLWLSAIVFAIAFPFYFVATLVESSWLAITVFAVPAMANLFATGPVLASLQGLVKVRMRAMIVAIFLLGTNLIGVGLGPLLIGFISDSLSARLGSESLRYALTPIPFVLLWAALHLVLAARTQRADLARASDAA